MGNVPTKDVSATSSGSSSRSRSASTSRTTESAPRRSTRLGSSGRISSSASSRGGEYGGGSGAAGSSRSGKKKATAGEGSLVTDGSEMVDGGYLVPQGVYSGAQDFKVKVVRNLMVRIEDYEDTWTDRQLLAAVRGLPIPSAALEKEKEEEEERVVEEVHEQEQEQEEEEDDSLKWVSSSLPNNSFLQARNSDEGAFSNGGSTSNQSIHSSINDEQNRQKQQQQQQQLQPPLTPLTSPDDQETIPFPSTTTSSSPSTPSTNAIKILEFKTETMHIEESISTSPKYNSRPREGSAKLGPPIMFPRNRANTTSKYSSAPIIPTRANLPPMEVTLYRGAIECPICFLNYPKYLNTTRCCTQPICSECFVQIKRAEPHAPYHGENSPSNPSTPPPSMDNPEEALVSDPACCPFCQMADFGVVYVPSPYRSGIPASSLTSSLRAHLSSSLSNVFSSHHHTPVSSSAASTISMSTTNSTNGTPRRGSLPPNAPEVVTTDQIRPDWAMKLSRARHQLARKSAAANALHASAFLFEADGSSSHSRRHHEKRKKSSSRLRGISNPSSPSSTLGSSSSSHGSTSASTTTSTTTSSSTARRHTTSSPGPPTSFPIPTRTRIRDLEDMMIVEAIRRSLTDDRPSPSAESSKTAASQSSKEVKKDEITTR